MAAGRIRDEDIVAVRERADIEAIVGQHVTLKRSGSSLKGLCPFHDEKSGSFYVSPARASWHCFGCGEGGDAIAFLMKVDNLTFVESVEYLASQAGITLRYEEGHTGPTPEQRAAASGQRARLLAVLADAADFYSRGLGAVSAAPAREFLTERGFGPADATRFGCGFSPDAWDMTLNYLKSKGHTDADIVTSGMASKGERRTVDRFRGRLMFPIRDASGAVIGFGARKILDTDDGPKYLNSPETPVYKKTSVLYGIDAARKDIAKTGRAVIVEGYTDVMACHLAGITTAVATCGTAFGEEHVRVLRRFLGETHALTGEVIYTFDGDAAGQKAALKSFELDGKFITRTFVAVEPSGMDPCELRQAKGADGVNALIDSRVPLFTFAVKAKIARHDLTTAEGRINAMHEAAPILGHIKDADLRPEYARELAKWLSMPVDSVLNAVDSASRTPLPVAPTPRAAATPAPTVPQDSFGHYANDPYSDEPPPPEDDDYYGPPDDYHHPNQTTSTGTAQAQQPAQTATPLDPSAVIPPADPNHVSGGIDRALLRAVVAFPTMIPTVTAIIEPGDFTHPAYIATWNTLVTAAAQCGADKDTHAGIHLLPTAAAHSPNPAVRTILSALAVDPAYKPANTDIEATLELTPDSATIYALSLAIAATHRHEDTIDGALAADNLPGPQVMALFAENEAIHGRRKELKARQKAALTALLG